MNYRLKALVCTKAEKSQLCCQEWQAGPHRAQAQGEDKFQTSVSLLAFICLAKNVNRSYLQYIQPGATKPGKSLPTRGN